MHVGGLRVGSPYRPPRALRGHQGAAAHALRAECRALHAAL